MIPKKCLREWPCPEKGGELAPGIPLEQISSLIGDFKAVRPPPHASPPWLFCFLENEGFYIAEKLRNFSTGVEKLQSKGSNMADMGVCKY